MTICIIRNHSLSCSVNLSGEFFLLLKFIIHLIPFILALVFYFFGLSDLREERSFISFFLVCAMFACICGFILEHVTVAVISGCFSYGVLSDDIDKINDLVLDFKFFERVISIAFVTFFIMFKLSA